MNDERNQQIQRFKSLIDNGNIYQALRQSLALRPPPNELRNLFQRQMGSNESQAVTGGRDPGVPSRGGAAVDRSIRRASDPNHPVGLVATHS